MQMPTAFSRFRSLARLSPCNSSGATSAVTPVPSSPCMSSVATSSVTLASQSSTCIPLFKTTSSDTLASQSSPCTPLVTTSSATLVTPSSPCTPSVTSSSVTPSLSVTPSRLLDATQLATLAAAGNKISAPTPQAFAAKKKREGRQGIHAY